MVPKEAGARVVAGTVAGGGSLRVRVTAIGEQTALSGIMRLVAGAGFKQVHDRGDLVVVWATHLSSHDGRAPQVRDGT